MPSRPARPVFLNLLRIRLPIAGVMSIAHRLSGVLMVLMIPLGLYLMQRSLVDAAGFAEVRTLFDGTPVRLALFLSMWALLHHLFAGIRYLLIDIDVGVEKPTYRYTAWLVMFAAPVGALLICLGARG
ncbi:MAG: succinate dehydrogenase, cytochrome b556 subunit [Gammaproteobacteria bacterium]|nr:succinate dehydrogenase, cytochrome b556 subunit [Gammaproteobacteria bacterium]